MLRARKCILTCTKITQRMGFESLSLYPPSSQFLCPIQFLKNYQEQQICGAGSNPGGRKRKKKILMVYKRKEKNYETIENSIS